MDLHGIATRAADHAPVPVQVLTGDAEHLPADTGTIDAIVASLVLCSVRDQSSALTEFHRALRPGGELRYYEHVRSNHRLIATIEDIATPLWSRVTGGCHLNRDTTTTIQKQRIHHQTTPQNQTWPRHILGTARPALGSSVKLAHRRLCHWAALVPLALDHLAGSLFAVVRLADLGSPRSPSVPNGAALVGEVGPVINLDLSLTSAATLTQLGIGPFQDKRVDLGDRHFTKRRLDDGVSKVAIAVDSRLFSIMDAQLGVEQMTPGRLGRSRSLLIHRCHQLRLYLLDRCRVRCDSVMYLSSPVSGSTPE